MSLHEELRALIDEFDRGEWPRASTSHSSQTMQVMSMDRLRAILARHPEPTVSEGAKALLDAADEADEWQQAHDVAECAGYVEGEVGRQAAIDGWIDICEDPASWLRSRSAQLQVQAPVGEHGEHLENAATLNVHSKEKLRVADDEREGLIDVLVMSPMSDFVGTEMGPVERTADALIAAGYGLRQVPDVDPLADRLRKAALETSASAEQLVEIAERVSRGYVDARSTGMWMAAIPLPGVEDLADVLERTPLGLHPEPGVDRAAMVLDAATAVLALMKGEK